MSTIRDASRKEIERPIPGNAHVQKIQYYIHKHLESFPELKKVSNIESILLAQEHVESTYQPWVASRINGKGPGTAGHDYVTDSLYRAAKSSNVPEAILQQGLQGWGLGQALGMYLYRGSVPGKYFMQNSTYKAKAESVGLIVPIGTDLTTIFTDSDIGIERGVVSHLITLDSKYAIYRKSKNNQGGVTGNWMAFFKGLASYLGNPNAVDGNGTSPIAYANNILNIAKSPPMQYIPTNSKTSSKTMVASTNSAEVVKPAPGCAYPGCA